MTEFGRSPVVIVACAALLVVLAVLFAPTYYVSLMIVVGITAIAATGLVLLLIAGQVSLGHAAYMGLGAYGSAILARDYGLAPALSIPIAVAGTCAFSAIIGWLTLRLKGHYLPLATLAIGIALSVILVAAGDVTGGASGYGQIPALSVPGYEITDTRAYAALTWAILALATLGSARLLKARQGRAIRALRGQGEMAAVFGVNTVRLRILVFVLSCGLAALAGTLYAHYFRFISPAPFGLTASFNLLIAAVIGGSGHPVGAVIGAIVVMVLETMLQNTIARSLGLSGHVEMIVFGVILIALLLRFPGGIWSALQSLLTGNRHTAPRMLSDAGEPSATPVSHGRNVVLAVDNISKNFGGLQALENVSFSIEEGEIVGLIGPNGAGKSTTFNIVSGLIAPSAGAISIFGGPLPPRPHQLVAKGVARTFQHVKLVPTLSVFENVALGAYVRGRAGVIAGMTGLDKAEETGIHRAVWQALATVGLAVDVDRPATSLAMGDQRLVEVARAIASRPRLLLLDEPAAGLRTGEKVALLSVIHRLRRKGTSVLLVEHDMELVMNGVDRIIVLDRGRPLADGPPESVRSDPRVVEAYLGA